MRNNAEFGHNRTTPPAQTDRRAAADPGPAKGAAPALPLAYIDLSERQHKSQGMARREKGFLRIFKKSSGFWLILPTCHPILTFPRGGGRDWPSPPPPWTGEGGITPLHLEGEGRGGGGFASVRYALTPGPSPEGEGDLPKSSFPPLNPFPPLNRHSGAGGIQG